MPRLHVGVSKMVVEAQFNGLIIAKGLQGMLERKNYKKADMVFPFLTGFIVECTAWMEEAQLMEVLCSLSNYCLVYREKMALRDGKRKNC